MKGVQDRDGVLELVVDRVLVPVERVERGDLHVRSEHGPAGLEPVGVRGPGPSRNQVQQPGPHVPALVTGQVDHPGQLLRAALARVHVMPDVLIDTQGRHARVAGLVGGPGLEQRADRAPHGAPGDPELTGQSLHGRVLATHLTHRPLDRPRREQSAWGGERVVGLGERPHLATDIRAGPAALAPGDPCRPPKARDIDQRDRAPGPWRPPRPRTPGNPSAPAATPPSRSARHRRRPARRSRGDRPARPDGHSWRSTTTTTNKNTGTSARTP